MSSTRNKRKATSSPTNGAGNQHQRHNNNNNNTRNDSRSNMNQDVNNNNTTSSFSSSSTTSSYHNDNNKKKKTKNDNNSSSSGATNNSNVRSGWLNGWSQRNVDNANGRMPPSSSLTNTTGMTTNASSTTSTTILDSNNNNNNSNNTATDSSLTAHFIRPGTRTQRRSNITTQRSTASNSMNINNNNNNIMNNNNGGSLSISSPTTTAAVAITTRSKKSLKKGPIQPADYNYNDSHELRTETVTDTHHVHKVWTIKNWSGIPQNEGYILYDQEFSFVNHRWRLRLYPGGVTEQVKGYMSFYLDCRDATDEHPAHERHTFRVVNQLNPSKHWEQHSLPYKEHRDPDGWGWGKFLSHEYLKEESQGYRINDTIIFELELYVYGEKKNIVTRELGRREVPKTLVVDVPSSTLSVDMNRLFNDEKFSDIMFSVGDIEFPAHKCILSVRSPMLYAMFSTSGMRETRAEKVVVEDIEADIFREILRFIYTGECSLDVLDNMPIQLLAAADKYQIIRLKCMCENRLFERMTVTDCADVLVAADMHNADALYQRCLSFMTESAEKVKEVMETEAFKYLTETRPKLMIAIMHAMSEEDIVMTPSKKRLLNLEQQHLNKLNQQSSSSLSSNDNQNGSAGGVNNIGGNKRQRIR